MTYFAVSVKSFLMKNEIFVPTLSQKADDIIDEAIHIVKILGIETTCIKIPAIPEGFKAMEMLNDATEIHFSATEIYMPIQAIIAAQCGAMYISLYINQIDKMGFNGVELAKQIQEILDRHNMETEVICEDFKNVQQVVDVYKFGIETISATPAILKTFIESESINPVFKNLIGEFTGNGKTMLNFE